MFRQHSPHARRCGGSHARSCRRPEGPLGSSSSSTSVVGLPLLLIFVIFAPFPDSSFACFLFFSSCFSFLLSSSFSFLFSSPSSYSLSPSSLLRGSIPFPSGAPQRPPDLGRAGADPDPPGLALEWRRHDRHSASASELSLAALIPRPGKSGNFSALSLCSVISVVRSACSEVTGLARLKFRVAVEPSVRGALRALKTRG